MLPPIRGDRRLIVFDWDGTVIDSVFTIVRALQQAAADLALPVPTDQQARFVIGLGLDEALSRVVPSLEPARYPAYVDRYRLHFMARAAADVPFPGIPDLLAELTRIGLRLAVATGKSRAGLDRALRDTGLGGLFAATRCADEGRSKPHPWMLHSLSDALDIAPDRMLMIGDTSHDIEMARAAGVASIGVAYGAHDPGAVAAAAPDAIATTVTELAQLLGVAPQWPPATGPVP
ncbi:MAG: HAD-IA family hydrolase [Lautropia sp.]